MRTVWQLACVAVILGTTQAAWAGGFYTPPHGVRPSGRAGTAVLGVADMNALWYNPALLADIGDFHAMLDINLVGQAVAFSRETRLFENGDMTLYPTVENEAASIPIPQLGAAMKLGESGLVLALGAFAPNGSTANYDVDGPARYTIVDTEGSLFLTVELALAGKITDWLWVGAGIQNTFVNLRLINVVTSWPGFTGDPEDPGYDILFEGKLGSAFTPSGNVGLRAEVAPGLEFGLSAQLPTFIKDDNGVAMQRLPDEVLFDEAEVVGSKITGEFELPWILRGGARYSQPSWDIELDVSMELWSSLENIDVTPVDVEVQNVPGIGTIVAGALSVPRQYEDILSVRLGGDAEVVPELLTLRAGALWEQSAIPSHTLSVLQVDADKVGLSVGGTVAVGGGVKIDVAYTHVFYKDTVVTDSIVRQLNPTDPDNSLVVGNGKYEASVNMLGIGVRYDL